MTSGLPYLGGWGVGAPWALTPEELTRIRGRILGMATHENAQCLGEDAGPVGYVDTVPPLVQLTAFVLEAIQGPVLILDRDAHVALLDDFRVESVAGSSEISSVAWSTDFNWMRDAWQMLRVTNDIAATASILDDIFDVVAEIPPLADAAKEASRLVRTVSRTVPAARLDAATVDQLTAIFADALDDEGARHLPWLRGPDVALAALEQQLRTTAHELDSVGIDLPGLEELLVDELVQTESSVSPVIRNALGGQTFMRVRERVSADEATDVDRAAISNALARAVRSDQAVVAHQWVTAAYRLLAAAVDGHPTVIDIETFALDLADVTQARRAENAGGATHDDERDNLFSDVDDSANDDDRIGAPADDPWLRLDRMVGLSGVKSTVRRALRGADLADRRRDAGITLKPPARHLLFLGNPGTGKTEVARLIGEIYRERGVLRTGKLTEVSRADLVGEGIGETAPKVRKQFAKAMGGVLFIDEAYTLNVDGHSDYGKEAVDELMTLMETHRDDVLVIAAGYREQMQSLLRANPGLESRFGNRVSFDDFSDDELVEIFHGMVRDARFDLADGVEKEVRSHLPRKRTPRYGNAREMRRLFEATVERQGMRLSGRLDDLTDEEVRTLTVADIREDRHDDEQRRRIFRTAEQDLSSLVGLDPIKREVAGLVNEVQMEDLLREAGVRTNDDARHMLFLGNPGTGKTEVARILARIYHGLGLLSQGHLVEVHRSDLVAGYIGQTALKTESKLESAIGGVLFIDEAYSLATGYENDFGQEAISKLITFMEDYRDDLVVIAAGYGEEMDDFLASNSGLASRFPIRFDFPDYSDDELIDVLIRFAQADGRTVGPEALAEARRLLAEKRDRPGFGNARDVRNLFSAAKRHQISRLADERSLHEVQPERVRTLLPVDFAQSMI
ncbi:AAA family ATPase [Brevibacterium sp. Mu109]|uniref:AAA family ATPase n=1 Tax=Brevibacterium sp. Mu109 TaxID=1255669 RepID=UPI0015E0E714|nr:AAA family ATPase [Brevibacterium sp. Mu109]